MSKTPIRFSKMHGLGNDFIVIDNTHHLVDVSTLPTARMADRHLGIGCDQLLVIETSKKADFFCRILNADGSEAEQCGNGLRSVARYVHEQGLHSSFDLTIETIAGVFPVHIKSYDQIRVSLPTGDMAAVDMQIPIPELDTTVTGTTLAMGNPHFIIEVDQIDPVSTYRIGSAISTHQLFPQGTNVGFVKTINLNHIELRTFERGSGATLACGSNACAAVAAGILNARLGNAVNVEFEMGSLLIEWEGKGRPVEMTGPAAYVYTGEWIDR